VGKHADVDNVHVRPNGNAKDAALRRLRKARWCEVRIGELLGPTTAEPGPGRGKPSRMNDGLVRNERHAFRLLAAHQDLVARFIAKDATRLDVSRVS
jgi:hypothetical protein